MPIRPLIAAMTLTLIPVWAVSQASQERGASQRVRLQQRVAKELKLSEAQQASIIQIRARHEASLQTARQRAREAGSIYRAAAQDRNTPKDRLKQLHQAASEARFAVLTIQREQRQEIEALLSPEQREKAAELRGYARGQQAEQRKRGAKLP